MIRVQLGRIVDAVNKGFGLKAKQNMIVTCVHQFGIEAGQGSGGFSRTTFSCDENTAFWKPNRSRVGKLQIASRCPPQPSESNGGGWSQPLRCFTPCHSSMAASVSVCPIPRPTRRRVATSISVQRQYSPLSSGSRSVFSPYDQRRPTCRQFGTHRCGNL